MDSDNGRQQELDLVVENLNRAFINEERTEAVIAACTLFDHGDDKRHVQEIYTGADRALVKLLNLSMSFADPDAEEIALLVKALDMVYRCPGKYVWTSYLDVAEVLIPLYIGILELCLSARDNLDPTVVDITNSLLKISNCRFSSDSIDSRPVVDGMGMIAQLVGVADSMVDIKAKINAIITISNLTHETEDSVLLSMATFSKKAIPNLLITTATNPLFGDKTRKVSLGGLLNISSLAQNQALLGVDVGIIHGLCNLMREEDPDFKRGATAILDCFSKHPSSGIALVKYKKGIAVTSLIRMTHEMDDTICRSAISSLRNLLETPEVEKAMKSKKMNIEVYKCLAKSTAKLHMHTGPMTRGLPQTGAVRPNSPAGPFRASSRSYEEVQ